MSRNPRLLRGAAALAAAGLIIKVTNLLVRIPLTRLIGGEGLGIYQMVLPAFHALFHVASGGLPVAVQNLVSEYAAKGRHAVADQVLRLALVYTCLAGGAAAGLLLVGAPLLARLLGEPRTYWSLIAVAPAIPIFAFDSIYRNYLQGFSLMIPTATASLIEQSMKIAVTLVAAYVLIHSGIDHAAAGAALGITAGALLSLLYMIHVCQGVRGTADITKANTEPPITLIRRMIALALPVTLGNISLPLLSLLDVGVVQRGFLQAGYSQAQATAMYGAYSGIALTVVWFPFVLTNALGNAMVPSLVTAFTQSDLATIRRQVFLGLRAASLICLPVATAVAVMAEPIAQLFGAPIATLPLLYMAPVAYFGPLSWLLTMQLQALNRTIVPMRNMTLAMLLKIGLDACLAPIPHVDVKGVALASVIMFFVCCWLNAHALQERLQEALPWSRLLRRPLMASAVMTGGLFGMRVGGLLPQAAWAALAMALVLAPLTYLGLLLVSGEISRRELVTLSSPITAGLERWLHLVWPWS